MSADHDRAREHAAPRAEQIRGGPDAAPDSRENDAGERTTEEVMYHHLWCSLHHDLETDVRDNYADDVVMIEPAGVFHGPAGIKSSRRLLRDAVPGARYEYTSPLSYGEYALLHWRAHSSGEIAAEGVDSFVVRGGRIVFQTAYYRVTSGPQGAPGPA